MAHNLHQMGMHQCTAFGPHISFLCPLPTINPDCNALACTTALLSDCLLPKMQGTKSTTFSGNHEPYMSKMLPATICKRFWNLLVNAMSHPRPKTLSPLFRSFQQPFLLLQLLYFQLHISPCAWFVLVSGGFGVGPSKVTPITGAVRRLCANATVRVWGNLSYNAVLKLLCLNR